MKKNIFLLLMIVFVGVCSVDIYANDNGCIWQEDESGHWYYTDIYGNNQIGWQHINGRWYYMNENGVMTTGWQYVNGRWYYMNWNGTMTTGWQYVGNRWYYMSWNGTMTTGWQYVGGNWYYMNGNGVMATGWQYIGGSWYYMNGSGAMTTGWQYIGSNWYYMNGSGAMATGWKYINSTWYYLSPSGEWSNTSQMDTYAQKYSSSTNYMILVDREACIVGVYYGSKGNWVQQYAWACGPGKQSTPTVNGEFTIYGRGKSFGSKTYTCWYYTQFYGNYLFHSVLYNHGSMTEIQDGTLGKQVSHGCVRLDINNAKWLYDNIPNGTKVVIY